MVQLPILGRPLRGRGEPAALSPSPSGAHRGSTKHPLSGGSGAGWKQLGAGHCSPGELGDTGKTVSPGDDRRPSSMGQPRGRSLRVPPPPTSLRQTRTLAVRVGLDVFRELEARPGGPGLSFQPCEKASTGLPMMTARSLHFYVKYA